MSLIPPPPLLGLDIETDTSVDGLDPSVGRVLAVAVADTGGVSVFDGADESALLGGLDQFLSDAEPGVLVTWNGAAFDLPYLATRAAVTGTGLGLRLAARCDEDLRHAPLAGHSGSYSARWYHHRHLDLYRVYRSEVDPESATSCSLKSVARTAGLRPIEVDPARVHLLSASARAAYVASDARCTAELARRRWPGVDSWVDSRPNTGPLR